MSFGKFTRKEINDIVSCSWSQYWLRPAPIEWDIQLNSASVFGVATTGRGYYNWDYGGWTFGYRNTGSISNLVGSWSFAVNYDNIAAGDYSFAHGYQVTASGESSHAEGWLTRAGSSGSHTEGYNTSTGDPTFGARSTVLVDGAAVADTNLSWTGNGAGQHGGGFYTPNANWLRYFTNGLNQDGTVVIDTTTWPGNTLYYIPGGNTSVSMSVSMNSVSYTINAILYDPTANNYKIFVNYTYPGTVGPLVAIAGAVSPFLADTNYPLAHPANFLIDSLGYIETYPAEFSHAEGVNTLTAAVGAHSEGYFTTASGDYSHAEGSSSITIGVASHAGGLHTIASSSFQTVFGRYNLQNNTSDYFVIGDGTEDYFESRSNALGVNATRFYASNSIFFPDLPDALHPHFILFNTSSKEVFYRTGSNVIVGTASFSYTTKAAGIEWDIQLNSASFDSGTLGVARLGRGYYNDNLGAWTFGYRNTGSVGTWSFAINYDNLASGDYSFVQGLYVTASGTSSHAQGNYTEALGDYSHVEGSSSISLGIASHAEGLDTIASGAYSHAEGIETTARGRGSHAEGYNTNTAVNGILSHAEGGYTIAYGQYSHTEGYFTTASYFAINEPAAAHAEGMYTEAAAQGSHAEGSGSISYGKSSHAEGIFTVTVREGSHAEGFFTSASGEYSHAEGKNSISIGPFSHVEGSGSISFGTGSHAEGLGTLASASYSHTEGELTTVLSRGAHAEGYGTYVDIGSVYAHSEGYGTYVKGPYSHAEGYFTTASAISNKPIASHTEGWYTIAFGIGNHAEGYGTIATIDSIYSHTEGVETTSSAYGSHAEGFRTYIYSGSEYSHAEGGYTYIEGDFIHTEGYLTSGYGSGSHAEGYSSSTSGSYSHAEGYATQTTGSASHTEGIYTITRGESSHAEGSSSIANADYSHTEGRETQTYQDSANKAGQGAHAEGYQSITSGSYSHAEGYQTNAKGLGSHTEGFNTLTVTQGTYAHSEGGYTTSSKAYAHAEGYYTYANGIGSHAEGSGSIANGNYAHAGGLFTIAHSEGQTAVGRYNLNTNTSDYFVVGDGTEAARSNAFGVNDTRMYASNSIFFPDLTNVFKQHLLVYDTASKQVFFHTGSAYAGTGGSGTAISFYSASVLLTSNLSSLFVTGSGVRATTNASNGVTMSFTAGTGGGSAISVSNEGSLLTSGVTSFNFVGNAVDATGGPSVTVTINTGSNPAGLNVMDEGSTTSNPTTDLNFVGPGVSVVGAGAGSTVYIPSLIANSSFYLDRYVANTIYYGKAKEGWNATIWDLGQLLATPLTWSLADQYSNCGVPLWVDLTDGMDLIVCGNAYMVNGTNGKLQIALGYVTCGNFSNTTTVNQFVVTGGSIGGGAGNDWEETNNLVNESAECFSATFTATPLNPCNTFIYVGFGANSTADELRITYSIKAVYR